MRLSALQKYILLQCYNRIGFRIGRGGLERFYDNREMPKAELLTKIITHSIERLIDNGFLFGFGMRTTEKWFIREIKLTKEGLKVAQTLASYQQRLPLRK